MNWMMAGVEAIDKAGLAAKGAWGSASPFARRTAQFSAGGAALGGAYGAFSDDTSVLGGALKGAALGAGGFAAVNRGMMAAGGYRGARALGMGRGKSLGMGLAMMGRKSARDIGNTVTQGFNSFKGMVGNMKSKKGAAAPFWK